MTGSIITILITAVGTSGLWTFITHIFDSRVKQKEKEEKRILKEKEDKIKEEKEKENKCLENIQNDLNEIKEDLAGNNELTLSIGRDRVNSLCNRYLELGYIPLEEYDSFIGIGEAYIKKGNSSVKGKFIKCRDNLKVVKEEKENVQEHQTDI